MDPPCILGRQDIGDVFVRHTGLARYAEANELMVLYPQASHQY